jgi:hypothetical protein
MSEMLEAALGYAARGWLVFPVPPGSKRSYKSAEHSGGRAWGKTRDAEEIKRDWRRWPRANIGLPTGPESGFIVLETDTIAGGHKADGRASLAALEAELGPLPVTRTAATPSGSVHRYFRHPGVKVTSRSNVAPGVDVKGDGGMVVAPPSRKGDDAYVWLDEGPLAALPDAWLAWLTADKSGRSDLSEREPRLISERQEIKTPTPVTPAPSFVKLAHAGCGVSLDPDDAWQPPSDDEVLYALGSIDPHALTYSEWFGIACALAEHFGQAGFEHFVEWSEWSRQRYPKGISPKTLWRSLRNRDGYTVATVFHFANEHSPNWRAYFDNWRETNAEA